MGTIGIEHFLLVVPSQDIYFLFAGVGGKHREDDVRGGRVFRAMS